MEKNLFNVVSFLLVNRFIIIDLSNSLKFNVFGLYYLEYFVKFNFLYVNLIM